MKALLSALAALILAGVGTAAIILGEVDDSPGLMLLGVLFGLGGIWLGVRTVRAGRRK